MMLLATVSLSTASHLVGLVGPYKQPYRKTPSLNRVRYEANQRIIKSISLVLPKRQLGRLDRLAYRSSENAVLLVPSFF